MESVSNPHPLRRLAALLMLSGVVLAGCQGDPVQRLANVPDPSEQLGPGGLMWINPSPGSSGGALGHAGRQYSRTFALDGSKGGTYTFDRYTVSFPPGAVAGNGFVTIVIPNPIFVGCDLSISPSNLNGFSKPVTLTMGLVNTNVTPLNIDGVSIYWDDPSSKWVKVGSKIDKVKFTVGADLQHFSAYRAGW
ncbi:MAG: hypothetical protein HZB25_09890 [Candidatus Eisenbacteria bacterium]|nr:hypothetical protein [Candidatus Eisenbacteria bacterium]